MNVFGKCFCFFSEKQLCMRIKGRNKCAEWDGSKQLQYLLIQRYFVFTRFRRSSLWQNFYASEKKYCSKTFLSIVSGCVSFQKVFSNSTRPLHQEHEYSNCTAIILKCLLPWVPVALYPCSTLLYLCFCRIVILYKHVPVLGIRNCETGYSMSAINTYWIGSAR